MQQKNFKEQFPKNHRPEITDLQLFREDALYHLFKEFAEYIAQNYDLRFGIPLWTEKYGKDDMEHMEKNIIRCHRCNNELDGEADFRDSAPSCGHELYRRNQKPCRANYK